MLIFAADMPSLTLLAVYSHAFGSGNICDNFCGLGGKYDLKRTEFGLFTGYTRVLGIDEWATELICSLDCYALTCNQIFG